MLQRYLGNKSTLNADIVRIIQEIAPAGAHVCDAFAGSISVGAALKRSGYRVSSNDVNILSWIYGVAYLGGSSLPEIDLDAMMGVSAAKHFRRSLTQSEAAELAAGPWREAQCLDTVLSWMALLSFVISPYRRNEMPREFRRHDFHDHYCEAGERSAFTSARGSSGNRRFFTEDNASALDRATNRIRYWWRSGLIDDRTRCLLTACLLDGMERVANTQGTYHDFPREFYDARALKPLTLSMPDADTLLKGQPAVMIGKARDSLDFIRDVPSHSVLYLDPPYNFRQYTAYYFLPNLVAKYPEIDDLDAYFEGVQYVRGQNMESDFTSTFCSSKRFVSSLEDLVKASVSEYVVLSYFNGKNHWHDFKSGTSDRGRKELNKFFQSELFESGSVRCHPVDRLNYQSYGGHKALTVSEYLFVAKRKRQSSKARTYRREVTHALV
ncbi:DNA adenine methylase [Pseudoxanthomonas mexicana]